MAIGKDAHGCGACRRKDTEVLQQLGEPQQSEYLGGKAREIQTYFKCTKCGALWVNIMESGAGGHGNFWHPRDSNDAL